MEFMMNERIRELAKKAGINLTPAQFSGVLEDEVDEFTLEDFAELIVQECVTAVMDGTKEGDHYAMRIEQHFDNGPGGILQFGIKE
jgi:hypothetical protein